MKLDLIKEAEKKDRGIVTSEIGKIVRAIASANDLVATIGLPGDTKGWVRFKIGFAPSAKAIEKLGIPKAHASTGPLKPGGAWKPSTWLDKQIIDVIKKIETTLKIDHKIELDMQWHGRPLYLKVFKKNVSETSEVLRPRKNNYFGLIDPKNIETAKKILTANKIKFSTRVVSDDSTRFTFHDISWLHAVKLVKDKIDTAKEEGW